MTGRRRLVFADLRNREARIFAVDVCDPISLNSGVNEISLVVPATSGSNWMNVSQITLQLSARIPLRVTCHDHGEPRGVWGGLFAKFVGANGTRNPECRRGAGQRGCAGRGRIKGYI